MKYDDHVEISTGTGYCHSFVAVQLVVFEFLPRILFAESCAWCRSWSWVVWIRWLSTTLNVLQLTPPGLTFIFQLAKRDRMDGWWATNGNGRPYVIFACFMLVTIHLICKCSFVADIGNTFIHTLLQNKSKAGDMTLRIFRRPFPFYRRSLSVLALVWVAVTVTLHRSRWRQHVVA